MTGPTFAVIGNVGAFRVHTGPDVKSPMEQVDAQFLAQLLLLKQPHFMPVPMQK